MSAESVLQAALLAALRGDAALTAGLNGVFEGPAVKASPPFAELGELLSVDWGTKTVAGRELRVAVTVRGAGDTGAAVAALAGMVGAAIEAVPRDLAGWRVASVALLRTRLLRGAPGVWAAVVEYRVRMMAV
ncbi:DUF3168 domain-containing protein [Sphingomonas hylomeconis]|uniref:DUF3168 domain-containing protein n=1 Tax=Sphingomonas hylomeconis TaxID=1395958 RepID=A0ABV7SYE6_9SPHN|nr:DUF3168 domain-containing protein [Sphingomonas hylomeconis]